PDIQLLRKLQLQNVGRNLLIRLLQLDRRLNKCNKLIHGKARLSGHWRDQRSEAQRHKQGAAQYFGPQIRLTRLHLTAFQLSCCWWSSMESPDRFASRRIPFSSLEARSGP